MLGGGGGGGGGGVDETLMLHCLEIAIQHDHQYHLISYSQNIKEVIIVLMIIIQVIIPIVCTYLIL